MQSNLGVSIVGSWPSVYGGKIKTWLKSLYDPEQKQKSERFFYDSKFHYICGLAFANAYLQTFSGASIVGFLQNKC